MPASVWNFGHPQERYIVLWYVLCQWTCIHRYGLSEPPEAGIYIKLSVYSSWIWLIPQEGSYGPASHAEQQPTYISRCQETTHSAIQLLGYVSSTQCTKSQGIVPHALGCPLGSFVGPNTTTTTTIRRAASTETMICSLAYIRVWCVRNIRKRYKNSSYELY